MTHNKPAEFEQVNRNVAEGERRITDQRRRIAGQRRAGYDTRLSDHLLDNFETTLRLMIEHRDLIARELGQISN